MPGAADFAASLESSDMTPRVSGLRRGRRMKKPRQCHSPHRGAFLADRTRPVLSQIHNSTIQPSHSPVKIPKIFFLSCL